MCLKIDTAKRKPSKNFRVYKVLEISSGRLVTPCQHYPVKEGVFKPKGKCVIGKDWDGITNTIDGGAIHAYQSKQDLEDNYNVEASDTHVMLVCTVSPKDFIAWGNDGDVAVKQITIPKGFVKQSIEGKELKYIKEEVNECLDNLIDNSMATKDLIKKLRALVA